jgi:Putative bacterial sensory transduction regulator
MLKSVCATVAAAIALGAAAPAMADVRASSPSSVVNALQQAGYKAEFSRDSGGDPMITSAAQGRTFIVFFFGCNNGSACKSIQFYAGFTDVNNASLAALNTWNAKHRFGRAYRADNGAARIEMDVLLNGAGVSEAVFNENLDTWTTLISRFDNYVNER